MANIHMQAVTCAYGISIENRTHRSQAHGEVAHNRIQFSCHTNTLFYDPLIARNTNPLKKKERKKV